MIYPMDNDGPFYTERDGDVVIPDVPDNTGWINETLLFDHSHVDFIDDEPKRKKRQKNIHDSYGFLATSPGELVRLAGLTDPDARLAAGAASYVSIVVRRQNNLAPKPSDPAAAGRAVTGEFVEYAQRARADKSFLGDLDAILEDSEKLPMSDVTTVAHLEGWEKEDYLRRAFADLMRLTETLEFVYGKGSDHLDDSYLSTSKETITKLKNFVATLSISEARDLIEMSIAQHEKQLAFWIEKLKEVEKYSTKGTKAMAKTALQNLGVNRAE